MKIRILGITMLLAMLLGMNAYAVTPRAAGGTPVLSFDGETAICYVDCEGRGSGDKVDATLTLYQGSKVVDSWNEEGYASVFIYGESPVSSGNSYKLVLSYSLNGVAQSSVSVSKTCP